MGAATQPVLHPTASHEIANRDDSRPFDWASFMMGAAKAGGQLLDRWNQPEQGPPKVRRGIGIGTVIVVAIVAAIVVSIPVMITGWAFHENMERS